MIVTHADDFEDLTPITDTNAESALDHIPLPQTSENRIVELDTVTLVSCLSQFPDVIWHDDEDCEEAVILPCSAACVMDEGVQNAFSSSSLSYESHRGAEFEDAILLSGIGDSLISELLLVRRWAESRLSVESLWLAWHRSGICCLRRRRLLWFVCSHATTSGECIRPCSYKQAKLYRVVNELSQFFKQEVQQLTVKTLIFRVLVINGTWTNSTTGIFIFLTTFSW